MNCIPGVYRDKFRAAKVTPHPGRCPYLVGHACTDEGAHHQHPAHPRHLCGQQILNGGSSGGWSGLRLVSMGGGILIKY